MAQTARQVIGIELPPAGVWKIDPAHSSVAFVARHMLSKVRGEFKEFQGAITVADAPERSHAEVEINAGSIDTGEEQRDQHLRSPDFLDVATYPVMSFKSTAVRPGEGREFQLVGDLTIKDVTREVVLDGEYLGWQPDPFSNTVLAATARATIDREDFGMTWNVVIEAGSILVGKKVDIEIDVEAVLQQDA